MSARSLRMRKKRNILTARANFLAWLSETLFLGLLVPGSVRDTQVPSTAKCQVPSTKYKVPSTKYYLALRDPLLGFARISEGHSGTNTPSSFLSKDLVFVRKVGIWQRWRWLMISVHIFFIVNAAGDLLDPHLLFLPNPLLYQVLPLLALLQDSEMEKD